MILLFTAANQAYIIVLKQFYSSNPLSTPPMLPLSSLQSLVQCPLALYKSNTERLGQIIHHQVCTKHLSLMSLGFVWLAVKLGLWVVSCLFSIAMRLSCDTSYKLSYSHYLTRVRFHKAIKSIKIGIVSISIMICIVTSPHFTNNK